MRSTNVSKLLAQMRKTLVEKGNQRVRLRRMQSTLEEQLERLSQGGNLEKVVQSRVELNGITLTLQALDMEILALEDNLADAEHGVQREAAEAELFDIGRRSMEMRDEYERVWVEIHDQMSKLGPDLARAFQGWQKSSLDFHDLLCKLEPSFRSDVGGPEQEIRAARCRAFLEDLQTAGLDLGVPLFQYKASTNSEITNLINSIPILDGMYVAAVDLLHEICSYGRQLGEKERAFHNIRHTKGRARVFHKGGGVQGPNFPKIKLPEYNIPGG